MFSLFYLSNFRGKKNQKKKKQTNKQRVKLCVLFTNARSMPAVVSYFPNLFSFSFFFSNLSKALSKILFQFHECAPCTSLNYTAKSSTTPTYSSFSLPSCFLRYTPPPQKKPSLSVTFHLLFAFTLFHATLLKFLQFHLL